MIPGNDAVTSNFSLFSQNEHGIACGNSFHLYTFLLKTFHFPGYCQAYHCNDLHHLNVDVFSRMSFVQARSFERCLFAIVTVLLK